MARPPQQPPVPTRQTPPVPTRRKPRVPIPTRAEAPPGPLEIGGELTAAGLVVLNGIVDSMPVDDTTKKLLRRNPYDWDRVLSMAGYGQEPREQVISGEYHAEFPTFAMKPSGARAVAVDIGQQLLSQPFHAMSFRIADIWGGGPPPPISDAGQFFGGVGSAVGTLAPGVGQLALVGRLTSRTPGILVKVASRATTRAAAGKAVTPLIGRTVAGRVRRATNTVLTLGIAEWASTWQGEDLWDFLDLRSDAFFHGARMGMVFAAAGQFPGKWKQLERFVKHPSVNLTTKEGVWKFAEDVGLAARFVINEGVIAVPVLQEYRKDADPDWNPTLFDVGREAVLGWYFATHGLDRRVLENEVNARRFYREHRASMEAVSAKYRAEESPERAALEGRGELETPGQEKAYADAIRTEVEQSLDLYSEEAGRRVESPTRLLEVLETFKWGDKEHVETLLNDWHFKSKTETFLETGKADELGAVEDAARAEKEIIEATREPTVPTEPTVPFPRESRPPAVELTPEEMARVRTTAREQAREVLAEREEVRRGVQAEEIPEPAREEARAKEGAKVREEVRTDEVAPPTTPTVRESEADYGPDPLTTEEGVQPQRPTRLQSLRGLARELRPNDPAGAMTELLRIARDRSGDEFVDIVRRALEKQGKLLMMPPEEHLRLFSHRLRSRGDFRPLIAAEDTLIPAGEGTVARDKWAYRTTSQAHQTARAMDTYLTPVESVIPDLPTSEYDNARMETLYRNLVDSGHAFLNLKGDTESVYAAEIPQRYKDMSREELLSAFGGPQPAEKAQRSFMEGLDDNSLRAERFTHDYNVRLYGEDYVSPPHAEIQRRSALPFADTAMPLKVEDIPVEEPLSLVIIPDLPGTNSGTGLGLWSTGNIAAAAGLPTMRNLKFGYHDNNQFYGVLSMKTMANPVRPGVRVPADREGRAFVEYREDGKVYWTGPDPVTGEQTEQLVSGTIPESGVKLWDRSRAPFGIPVPLKPDNFFVYFAENFRARDHGFSAQNTNFLPERFDDLLLKASVDPAIETLMEDLEVFRQQPWRMADRVLDMITDIGEDFEYYHADAIRMIEKGMINHPYVRPFVSDMIFNAFARRVETGRIKGGSRLFLIQDLAQEVEEGKVIVGDTNLEVGELVFVNRLPITHGSNLRLLEVQAVDPRLGKGAIMNPREVKRALDGDYDADAIQVVPSRALQAVDHRATMELIDHVRGRMEVGPVEIGKPRVESRPYYDPMARIEAMVEAREGKRQIPMMASLQAQFTFLRRNNLPIKVGTETRYPVKGGAADALSWELTEMLQRSVQHAKGHYLKGENTDTAYWFARMYGMEEVPAEWSEIMGSTQRTVAWLGGVTGKIASYNFDSLARVLPKLTQRLSEIGAGGRSYRERVLGRLNSVVRAYTRTEELTTKAGKVLRERVTGIDNPYWLDNRLHMMAIDRIAGDLDFRPADGLPKRADDLARNVLSTHKTFGKMKPEDVTRWKTTLLKQIEDLGMGHDARRQFDVYLMSGLNEKGEPYKPTQLRQAKTIPFWAVTDHSLGMFVDSWNNAHVEHFGQAGMFGPTSRIRDAVTRRTWPVRIALARAVKGSGRWQRFVERRKHDIKPATEEQLNTLLDDWAKFVHWDPFMDAAFTSEHRNIPVDDSMFVNWVNRVLKAELPVSERITQAQYRLLHKNLLKMRQMARAGDVKGFARLVFPGATVGEFNPFLNTFMTDSLDLAGRTDSWNAYNGDMLREFTLKVYDGAIRQVYGTKADSEFLAKRLKDFRRTMINLDGRIEQCELTMEVSTNSNTIAAMGRRIEMLKGLRERPKNIIGKELKAYEDISRELREIMEHIEAASPLDEKGKPIPIEREDLTRIVEYANLPASLQEAVNIWVLRNGIFPALRDVSYFMYEETMSNIKSVGLANIEYALRTGKVSAGEAQQVRDRLEEMEAHYRESYVPGLVEDAYDKTMARSVRIFRGVMEEMGLWTAGMEETYRPYLGLLEDYPAAGFGARGPGYAQQRKGAPYQPDIIKVLTNRLSRGVQDWFRSGVDQMALEGLEQFRQVLNNPDAKPEDFRNMVTMADYLTRLRRDALGLPQAEGQIRDLQLDIRNLERQQKRLKKAEAKEAIAVEIDSRKSELLRIRSHVLRNHVLSLIPRTAGNLYFASLIGLGTRVAFRNATQLLHSAIQRGFRIFYDYTVFASKGHPLEGPTPAQGGPTVNHFRLGLGLPSMATLSREQVRLFEDDVTRMMREFERNRMKESDHVAERWTALLQGGLEKAERGSSWLANRTSKKWLFTMFGDAEKTSFPSFQGIEVKFNREIAGLSAAVLVYNRSYGRYKDIYQDPMKASKAAYEDAIKAGKIAIALEHFDYHVLNTPELLRHPFFRTLFQFKSFSIYQTKLLWRTSKAGLPKWLLREDDPRAVKTSQEVAAFGRLLTSVAVASGLTFATGINLARFVELSLVEDFGELIDLIILFFNAGGDVNEPEFRAALKRGRAFGVPFGPLGSDAARAAINVALFDPYDDPMFAEYGMEQLSHFLPGGNMIYTAGKDVLRRTLNDPDDMRWWKFIGRQIGIYRHYPSPLEEMISKYSAGRGILKYSLKKGGPRLTIPLTKKRRR